MSNTHRDEHLVIVGAGLVGATLAAILSQSSHAQNLQITLIDRNSAPTLPTKEPYEYDPRVVALTVASQQVLENLGLWQSIEALGICHYQHMQVWDNDGTGAIDFHAEDIGQPRLGSIVENRIVLDRVLSCIEGLKNITILRGQGVKDIEQGETQATIVLEDGHRLNASLIVAADGGLSTVRKLGGFKVGEKSYEQSAIIATIKTEKSHQHTAWQNFLSTGPLAVLPLHGADERYSSIVWSADTALSDELMTLTKAAFDENLSRSLEGRLGQATTIGQRYQVPLIARHAENYFHKHIVLAGDAAHTIHPLAGQGVNLGLLDAASLAQEINRARSRDLAISDGSVLRRYQRQRKHQNAEMLLLMQGFKTLFGQRAPMARLARNYGLTRFNTVPLIKNWLAKQASGI